MEEVVELNRDSRILYQIEHILLKNESEIKKHENSSKTRIVGLNVFNIVAEWTTIKEVTDNLGYFREGIDQALKKGYLSSNYFWCWNYMWEQGWTPDLSKQTRNKRVYAYFFENLVFINRYKNAVICSEELGISVSNIRLVSDNEKYKSERKSHKGYFFSYKPLFEEDDILADIVGLKEIRNKVTDTITIDEQIRRKKEELNQIEKKSNKTIDLNAFENQPIKGFVTSKNTKFF